jgi:hypothetical protein
MKPDDFESQLQRQTLKPLPAAWRAEILQTAQQAGERPSVPAAGWSVWLWPCPQAWAGLAAVWLAILALNLAAGWNPFHRAAGEPADRAGLNWLALQEQQRRLAQLLDPPAPSPIAAPPKPAARPAQSWIGQRASNVV